MNVLLDLANPWGYVLVFLLAAAEGAALIGLFLPGETAMLLGGVLVYQGRADAVPMFLAGCLGAVLGDSVGYWAGGSVRSDGGGRGTTCGNGVARPCSSGAFSASRTLVSPLAGSTAMPYPRFVAFNAPAATLWAGGFIALGIAAGRSWQLVNRWAGRATLVLLLILVFAVGVVLFARWLSGRRDYVLDRWRAFLDDSTVKQLRDRFRPQLDFVRRRLDPAQRFGLYFTVGLLFAASAGLAFGALLDSLREGGDAAEVDRAVLEFFNSHRAEALDDVMRFLGRFGRVPLLGSATGLVGVAVSVSTRKLRWLLFTALAIFGTMLLDDLVSIALRAMPFTAERGSEVHDGRFQAIRRRRRPDSSARSCTRLGAGAAGVSPSGSEPPVSWARS